MVFEHKQNKFIIILLFLGIFVLLFSGCVAFQPQYDESQLSPCQPGNYNVSSEVRNNIVNLGADPDYISVTSSYMQCNATLILKEPILVLGSTVKSIPVKSVYCSICK